MEALLKALFTAEEHISDALEDINKSTTKVDTNVRGFKRELQELGGAGAFAQDAMDELEQASNSVARASEQVEQKVENVNLTLSKYDAGLISAEEATDKLSTQLNELLTASEGADRQIDSLESQLGELSESGLVTDQAVSQLERSIDSMRSSSISSSSGLQTLARSMSSASMSARGAEDATDSLKRSVATMSSTSLAATAPLKLLKESTDSVERGADDASRSVNRLTASLGALNTVAGISALQFSSLSVNIGPFNIALRNILTQLPAILTGMSTMLAIVSSLIGAFVTLGIVTGGLLIGGAIAFFEDLSAEFEDGAEAVEALMGALRDLFTEALDPLVNQENKLLFIDTIDAAARIINQFAQFIDQMRGDVLGFISEVDSDLGAMFEAMHDSFAIMEPILESFIEFFLVDFPIIMVRFAALTKTISGDLGTLMTGVGGLINELLDFASVILAGLTPVLNALIKTLIVVFRVINALPDAITTWGVTLLATSLIVIKLTSSLFGLVAALVSVHAKMVAQAGTGTILGSIYSYINSVALLYTKTNHTLAQSIFLVSQRIRAQIMALYSSIVAKIKEAAVTRAIVMATRNMIAAIKGAIVWMAIQEKLLYGLALAKSAIVGVTLGVISAFLGEAAASTVATAALTAYDTAATFAALATSTLTTALYALTSPAWGTVAAVLAIIAAIIFLIDLFTGGAISGAIGNFFGGIISWIQDTIDVLKELIGLGSGGGMLGGIGGPVDTDDIQSNPNLDLSFEESLEQNIDVQADPEKKEQMRRMVKDAMNEANSIARRQQGMGN